MCKHLFSKKYLLNKKIKIVQLINFLVRINISIFIFNKHILGIIQTILDKFSIFFNLELFAFILLESDS